MSTGTILVQDALSNIGAHSTIRPASPSTIQLGFRRLTAMMELWLSQGIKLGVTPLVAPGDQLNEPDDTTEAIVDNLSLKLIPPFNNGKRVVTAELRLNARLSMATVKQLYQIVVVPCKSVSGTLPRGEGGTRGRRPREFFISGRELES